MKTKLIITTLVTVMGIAAQADDARDQLPPGQLDEDFLARLLIEEERLDIGELQILDQPGQHDGADADDHQLGQRQRTGEGLGHGPS